MSVQDIHILQNCLIAVEPLKDEHGNEAGKCIIMVDRENGETWRFPMPTQVAETLANDLIGKPRSSIVVPDNAEAVANAVRNGGSHGARGQG